MLIYLFATLLIVALIAYFIFRKSEVKVMVNPEQENKYKQLLAQHIAYYQRLDTPHQILFLQRIESFLQNTRVEGVGLELTDLDRVMIASSAVIPIFGFDNWNYPNLTNVILYPDTFNNDFQFDGGQREITGMVGGGFMNGQMILSQTALQEGFSASAGKENTGVHEFVHLLDNQDGATDGMPERLLTHEYADPWLKLIHEEIRKIEDGKSDINPYATTNEAEFFAVASEYFFEKPEKLKEKHPQLYEMLCRIFMQNPAQTQTPILGG